MEECSGGTRAIARRAFKFAALAICATLGLALASAPALAKKSSKKPKAPKITIHTPVTRGLDLSRARRLGHVRVRGATVVPAPNYADAASFVGYPELLGSELHLNVVNAACPGETSSSMIDPTAQSNGCENAPGGGPAYRTIRLPASREVHRFAAWLRGVVPEEAHNVRLVSLMIGANDLLLCQETTADHCASLTEQAGVIGTADKNIATILSAIRNKAHYGGQIVFVNYYSPSPAQNSFTALGNASLDSATKPFHVVIADGFGQFAAGEAHSGGNTCTAGLLTQLSGGGCGIHPSYAGQGLLAQSVEEAIKLG